MAHILRRALKRASNGKRKTHYVIARRAKKPARKEVYQTPQVKKPVVIAKAKEKNLVKEVPVRTAILETDKTSTLRRLGANVAAAGPYHVQIGAFASKVEAENRLTQVGQNARSLLSGHQSFTMLIPDRNIYRARFGGFSESKARATCDQLKKRSIACMAISAE